MEGSLPLVAECLGCRGRQCRRVVGPDRPFRWWGDGASLVGYSSVDYSMVSAGVVAMWLAALAIYRTRSPRLLGNGVEETRRVLTATLSVFGVIAVFSMLFRWTSLAVIWRSRCRSARGADVNRWLAPQVVASCRRRGKWYNAVLAVGASKFGPRLRGIVCSPPS